MAHVSILNNMNLPILQLPLGFIRIVQFPMAILAFACTASYKATGFIKAETCSRRIRFGYPFDMAGISIPSVVCGQSPNITLLFTEGFNKSSQFFVFVGVISFLYIVGIVAVYLLLWPNYETDARFANVDFLVTSILAFFWFVASCAWSSGVSGLKHITSEESLNIVMRQLSPCPVIPEGCTLDSRWDYASLNVSLIAGFTCMALFLSNLWFIYKETAWFKARSGIGAGGQAAPVGQTAPVGQPAYH